MSRPVSQGLALESGIRFVTVARVERRHMDRRFFKFAQPAFDNNIVMISKSCEVQEQFPFSCLVVHNPCIEWIERLPGVKPARHGLLVKRRAPCQFHCRPCSGFTAGNQPVDEATRAKIDDNCDSMPAFAGYAGPLSGGHGRRQYCRRLPPDAEYSGLRRSSEACQRRQTQICESAYTEFTAFLANWLMRALSY